MRILRRVKNTGFTPLPPASGTDAAIAARRKFIAFAGGKYIPAPTVPVTVRTHRRLGSHPKSH